MAGTPGYLATPRIDGALSTTADASRTAPTNAATIITGAAGGTKIERIVFQAVDTTQKGVLCLFVHTTGSGGVYRCIDEATILPYTLNTPQLTTLWHDELDCYDLILPDATWSLRFTVQPTTASTNAGKIQAVAFGGNLS